MSIRTRLVVMCIVVSLLPAIPLSILVQTLLEKSFNLGLSSTVEDALQSGLGVSRAHLSALHADFEKSVGRVIPRLERAAIAGGTRIPDSLAAANAITDSSYTREGIDGVIVTRRAIERHDSSLPAKLSVFARSPEFERLVQRANIMERPTTGTARDGLFFFDTEDRAVQLAVWAADRGAVLFYKRTDPEFLQNANHLLEGRQIFAQLRLKESILSRSFFYPFVIIYGVILFVSLALALVMAERLSNPIRSLARGAEAVAQGDWKYRLETRAGGEVGRLVNAFNEMVSRLDGQRRRLVDMERMATWREMARHLAHEIKNPLLPIRLTVQELKDQYSGDDVRYQELVDESARVVGDELNHLQKLVKEFSSFARMPELSPCTGSLESLVGDVSRLYPQIPIHIDTRPNLREFPFDPDQMRRVVVNLLDNAVSVLESVERPEVRIRLDERDGTAVLECSDNGPGIPAEIIKRVFDPYFTTRTEGSGLGLAMVKNIVLLHGGSIEAKNLENGGAAFVVTLPLEGPPRNETA